MAKQFKIGYLPLTKANWTNETLRGGPAGRRGRICRVSPASKSSAGTA